MESSAVQLTERARAEGWDDLAFANYSGFSKSEGDIGEDSR